jgi:predicted AAA+ superfamily ATPase
MKRYLFNPIFGDLKRKMVFLTGPRQVGKTTLARAVVAASPEAQYLNFDDPADALTMMKREWSSDASVVVFDEIHKMRDWKIFLKGAFDKHRERQTFLVTGSARLDTFRQAGESLAGRYFRYRLHPLSVKELTANKAMSEEDALRALVRFGGFPEPFFSASEREAKRWRAQYFTDLVREDIVDFERVNEISTMRLLLEMLRKRVGSPLSFLSIAGDLHVSPNTVKRYVEILESLYIIFLVRPFHKNIARAVVKEPKLYFYDTGSIDGDDGARLENTVALALLKHAHWLQDHEGRSVDLHYGRTRDGKEVDFMLSEDGNVTDCIEVKKSDDTVSSALRFFQEQLPGATCLQIVADLKRDKDSVGVKVRKASSFLAGLSA